MPTHEEIKKIKVEVSERLYSIYGFSTAVKAITCRTIDEILEDYCIVPKKHIQMRHESCCILAETDPARTDMYLCQKRVLESIFGRSLFEEEK